MFYEVASAFIKSGGIVYGAGFDLDYRVVHKRIDRVEDLINILGSKYVQSDTTESIRAVLDDLKKGNRVLYSGTPCQIKAIKSLTLDYSERIFGISIICHGVPSPMVWKKYLNLKKGQYSENNIVEVSFRDKTFGWNDFSMKIRFANNVYIEDFRHDLYMQGFLSNLFLRKSCYECDFKGKQGWSDLILGDFWGIEKEKPNINSGRGCNCVIINSLKGEKLWKKAEKELFFAKVDYEQILRENSALEYSVPKNSRRDIFFDQLNNRGVIEETLQYNLHNGEITDNIRKAYQYQIIYRYLENRIRGLDICEAFINRSMRNIVLYGVTDILRLVLKDMEHFNDIKVYVADRNSESYRMEFFNNELLKKEELAEKIKENKIDAIIICNPLRENQIMHDLMKCGIKNSLVYSIVPFITDKDSF